MAFNFNCKNCGQKLSADGDQTGVRIQCPNCSTEFEVPQATMEDDSLPPPLLTTIWFYEVNSQHVGPVPENEIPDLVAAGVIKAHTRVWKKGTENWVRATETELKHIIDSLSGTPGTSSKADPTDLAAKPRRNSEETISYPKAFYELFIQPRLSSWLIFVTSSIIWIYQSIVIQNLKTEATPIVAKLNERHSPGHVVEELLQSVLSVVSGENVTSIHNGLDMMFGDNSLNRQLASIVQAIHSAQHWATLVGWIAVVSMTWICINLWRDDEKWHAHRSQAGETKNPKS